MGTTGNVGTGRLAEKLRSEYKNRGVSSVSEQMKRAEMGRDPRANGSANAFRDGLRSDGMRRGEGTVGGNIYNRRSGGAEASRRMGENASRAGQRNGGRPYGEAFERNRRRAEDEAYRTHFAEREAWEGEEAPREIRVERKKIPASFLLVLAFCTVMIMLIIMSVAQIYQTTREISGLERNVAALRETIDDLELKLDEKNDIRLIEQMATASLGMVKEDSLQRKYISLSEGEHIDLIETPAAAGDLSAEGGVGTMLSSIVAAFGDLFEYFK